MLARVLLALVIAMAFGLALWALYAKPEKEVVSAVLAGALALSAAIVGAGLTHYTAKEREAEEAHRLHKIEVYTEYTDLIVQSFSMVKEMEGVSDEEKLVRQAEMTEKIQGGFLSFSKKLLLWGSPEVLRTYQRFRSYGQAPANAGGPHVLLYADDVFTAMRKDLGLANEGLYRGDLMKLFITDPEEIDRLLRQ
jgi:hypothetical protein